MSDFPYCEHHVDSIENGGTVGWRWHIDAEHSVWCGEISRRCFDEQAEGVQEALGNDYGWFLVLYSKTSKAILGRAIDEYQGHDLAEAITLGLQAKPSLIAAFLAKATP